MGKSAKFYKRPSKKEKEGLKIKKIVEPSAIKKVKKTTIPITAVKNITQNEDVDMTMAVENAPKKTREVVETKEVPDYVDLFSGKKTYKKIPKKRK